MERKPLTVPVYVLLSDNALLLPTAKVAFAKADELPETGHYFVLTGKGLFVRKDGPIVTALVPVDASQLAALGNCENFAQLHLPKIPSYILARAHAFFKEVWHRHRGEAEVMLLYNRQDDIYDLWCPTQQVSGAGVQYQISELITSPLWQPVGTIHSHCNFGAFHSGTDVGDEVYFDGVHITLGNVDTEHPSFCASICAGKERWRVAPEKICSGVISKEERHSNPIGFMTSRSYEGRSCHVDIQLNEEEAALLGEFVSQTIRKEWMFRVQSTFESYRSSGSSLLSSFVWTVRDLAGAVHSLFSGFGEPPVAEEEVEEKVLESEEK